MAEPYSPWAHVQSMTDVYVANVDLEHAASYWEPDERVILLDKRLTQRERRSHLAHELAHIDRGDECCDVGPDGGRQGRRQEREADLLAAERLISLDALADALAWSLDCDEVALELHVDERLVRARLDGLDSAAQNYIERRLASGGAVA